MARTKEWREEVKGWADVVAQIMVIGWKVKGIIYLDKFDTLAVLQGNL